MALGFVEASTVKVVHSRRARRQICFSRRDEESFVPVELLAFGRREGGDGSTLALLVPTRQFERSTEKVVPIPLMTRGELDLVSSCAQPTESVTSVVDVAKTLFQTKDFYDSLPWKDDRKPNALASIYVDAAQGKIRNALDVLERMILSAPCKIVRLSLEEVESLSQSPVLAGRAYYRKHMVTILGQEVFSPEENFVECLPGEAISLTTRMTVPMVIPKWTWDNCAVRLSSDPEAKTIKFAESNSFAVDDEKYSDDRDTETGHLAPELLSKNQVLSMSTSELRTALRKVGIKSKTTNLRNELIDRLLPWLDEMVRYEIRLEESVRKENYNEAQQLYSSRSERTIVKEELDRAVEEERYLDAKRLKERLDRLKDLRADPTQDEGAYDPYLDQDEWYKPV